MHPMRHGRFAGAGSQLVGIVLLRCVRRSGLGHSRQWRIRRRRRRAKLGRLEPFGLRLHDDCSLAVAGVVIDSSPGRVVGARLGAFAGGHAHVRVSPGHTRRER